MVSKTGLDRSAFHNKLVYFRLPALMVALVFGLGAAQIPKFKPVIIEKEKPKPASQVFGNLNVQAKPWGYVYVPGYINKAETPVSGIKLKKGEHIIKVHYEPENLWAEKKILVAENSQIYCLASFDKGSSMTCNVAK